MKKLVLPWLFVAGFAACGDGKTEARTPGVTLIDDPRKNGQLDLKVSRSKETSEIDLQCVEVACGTNPRNQFALIEGKDGTFSIQRTLPVAKYDCTIKGYDGACDAADKTWVALDTFVADISEEKAATVTRELVVKKPNLVDGVIAEVRNEFQCVETRLYGRFRCDTVVAGSNVSIAGQLFDDENQDFYETGFRVDCGEGAIVASAQSISRGRFDASFTVPLNASECTVTAFSKPKGTEIEAHRSITFAVRAK